MAQDGAAVLDRAVTRPVGKAASARAGGRAGAPVPRRDLGEDFAPRRTSVSAAMRTENTEDEHYVPRKRFSGLRFRMRGGVPRSSVGRAVAICVVLGGLVLFTGTLWEARAMLLRNPRLTIASSASIQITGNSHLTRPQLLSVFGEDVDRNILTVPLSERRAELERLPWVEHATVMRLLPNKFKVAIVERTPVAFVRQGSTIGLVDATGVLLDMDSDGDDASAAQTKYSFPVVTGITAQEPLSTRTARMKLYMKLTAELDAGTDKISKRLSEVDLSNPEDVKALIPDGSSDVLVHFGDKDFLHRYELFEKNLPNWKREYPRLASADMRYERQVVLEMAPGAAVPVAGAGDLATPSQPMKPAELGHPKVAAKPAKVAAKVVAKPAAAPKAAAPASAAPASAAPTTGHLENAFDVHAKKGDTSGKTVQGPPQ